MAALGGNSERGVVNEKNARNDDFFGGKGVAEILGRRSVVIERQTRNRDAEKKRTRMAIRGGRIVESGVTRCPIISALGARGLGKDAV